MQYTASSFAQPLVDLVRAAAADAHAACARRRACSRATAPFATDTPDVVPSTRSRAALRGASARVLAGCAVLQQGRVQLYVLYIAVTLLALLVWKLVER